MIKPKAIDKCDKLNYKEVEPDNPITSPIPEITTKNKEVNKQKHDHSDAKMHD